MNKLVQLSLIKWLILTLVVLNVLSTGCKEDEPKPKTLLTLILSEQNQGKDILYDSIKYKNTIGNEYSITRLQYYLSDFRFHQKQGEWIQRKGVIYRDGRESDVQVEFGDLPKAEFDSIAFTFGLNEDNNVTGALPANTDNFNMAWPVPMGGGYHFIKMEGHHINSVSEKVGYALHVGTNIDRDNIKQAVFFDLNTNRSIDVVMDTDEWFQNPNTLDLNNISYTMGNDTMMQKVVQNGVSVFNVAVR